MVEGELQAQHEAGPSAQGNASEDDGDVPLLPFQQDIIEELLQSDGLTIMGKGMGLSTVAAALLMVHSATVDSGGVIIILGAC